MNIGEIAHEIINPLNIIVGCAELLKLDCDNNINKLYKNNNKNKGDEKINYIDEIIKQCMWCSELLQINVCNDKEKVVNLVNLLNELINDTKSHPYIVKKKLKLNYFVDNILYKNDNIYKCIEKYNIYINKAYIKIAIKNLLLNAIKNTPDKGIINIKICINDENDSVNIFIINEIINQYEKRNLKNYNSHFDKGNGYGLNVIDDLIHKMSGDWNIINEKNTYKVILSLPKIIH